MDFSHLQLMIVNRSDKINEYLTKDVSLIDKTTMTGMTPLHYAYTSNQINVMAELINKACDVNIQNLMGNTVLHLAARDGNQDATNLLINSGASYLIKNYFGRSPLQYIDSNSLNRRFKK